MRIGDPVENFGSIDYQSHRDSVFRCQDTRQTPAHTDIPEVVHNPAEQVPVGFRRHGHRPKTVVAWGQAPDQAVGTLCESRLTLLLPISINKCPTLVPVAFPRHCQQGNAMIGQQKTRLCTEFDRA